MLKSLNDAVDYIEQHLTNELAIEDIAKFVGESDVHFRKVFQGIAGIPLSEYIKKRKLSMANQDLLEGQTVTDVAFKYGYQSVEGFSRAFKNWSGYPPSKADKLKIILSFPKITFFINIRGGNKMEAKIVELPEFKFAGVQKRIAMQFEGVNQAIVELAESITEEQAKEMHKLMNLEPNQVVNISYDAAGDFIEENGDLTHMIGVLTTKKDISDRLEKILIPAHKWAVFPNEGPFPETLQNTMAQTASEWFPSSSYERVDLPSFSFTKMDEEIENYAYSEIWIPIQKNKGTISVIS